MPIIAVIVAVSYAFYICILAAVLFLSRTPATESETAQWFAWKLLNANRCLSLLPLCLCACLLHMYISCCTFGNFGGCWAKSTILYSCCTFTYTGCSVAGDKIVSNNGWILVCFCSARHTLASASSASNQRYTLRKVAASYVCCPAAFNARAEIVPKSSEKAAARCRSCLHCTRASSKSAAATRQNAATRCANRPPAMCAAGHRAKRC